ncbi:nitrate reductase molybdenum cofactor assembly chaperone [Rhizocola hellebori]|uniref:Nitrate reductase molybdenum cofactor assembly chaperone n=1 Tax=Rhizocola hellebori TaxID=1392758 RepID=A0A8J3VGI6_9ACTN|nr:nitrate reductase molybdenum cofactor assembly chaperone [Rhizocola hellebori]GIH05187.1 nitrate reductase molybdenum cofactor assembly chaperone [Rhizocola hellebori]
MSATTQPTASQTAHAIAAQAASLLLRYPDEDASDMLPAVREALAELPKTLARPLQALAAHRCADPVKLSAEYVDLFDTHRRHCLYLSYYTAGDTRNRGTQLVEFAMAYREAGFQPPDGELPDFLPAVLELAAQAGEPGWALLRRYRVGLDLLAQSLASSPYGQAIVAILATLPPAAASDLAAAITLARSGPQREQVGLQPFALPTGGRQ